ncbi:MAG: nitrous oxide reductase accessory protein NosL [Saprospiraceae bacterium]|nr:nitrous oxide reductase accessory protein NosL [Saprospiraceae bacterium]
MKPLHGITRLAVGLGSVAMIATLYMPLWLIRLWAPQYPEGLTMRIWHNKLSGDVDIINGLNHYIGMRKISVEMFPEFQFIGGMLILLIAVGVLTALLGRRRLLITFCGMAVTYGLAALYDFYRWGYDYGHNLDPQAAIKVPGMSYQPPVLGYKNLLNFLSYSGPDAGAWIIIAVATLSVLLLGWEMWLRDRKKKPGGPVMRMLTLAGWAFMATSASGCAVEPEPIVYGKDNCHFCKMTITDRRFGAELVTQKGKVYKFDDLNCLVMFDHSGFVPSDQVAQRVVVDFNPPNAFIAAQDAFFLQAEALRSPMRADIAALQTTADREKLRAEYGAGTDMDWKQVYTHLQK